MASRFGGGRPIQGIWILGGNPGLKGLRGPERTGPHSLTSNPPIPKGTPYSHPGRNRKNAMKLHLPSRVGNIFLLALPILTWACASASEDPDSITARELLSRLGSEDAPIVLDVRTAWEYQSGHIPGAYHLEDRQVPYRIEELKQLKDREIVVYCQVGPRARWVEGYLRQEGFTNVKHLMGDFSGWQRNGNPVE